MDDNDSQVPLDRVVRKVSCQTTQSARQQGEVPGQTDGVLRTTDLVTSVEAGSLESDEQPFKRQHPWV